MSKNRGLIYEQHPEDHEIYKRHLGAVETPVNLDGKLWLNSLPDAEIQKTDYTDFMDCVTESNINGKECLLKAKYNVCVDKSKRFTAEMSGTTQSGNTQEAVENSTQNDGIVDELDWPRNRTMTWQQYYSSIPETVKQKGKDFMKNWGFDSKFIWMSATDMAGNRAKLKEELKYGPVQITVYAWSKHADGLYYDEGETPNHAILLVGFDGDNPIIFDSYPDDFQIDQTDLESPNTQEFVKKLDANFHIGSAMRIMIIPKVNNHNSIIDKLKRMIDTLMAWFDDHGLHLAYVPKDSAGHIVGKQVISLEDPRLTLKALTKGMYDAGYFNKTDWATVSGIPDLTPDKTIK